MAGKLTLEELLRKNQVGDQAFSPFFQQLGLSNWAADAGTNEGGSAVPSQMPNQDALNKANGYTFDFTGNGPANTGYMSAYDPSGNAVGNYQQQDTPASQAMMDWAKLAAIGFGGAGLAGLGPLGGMLGGAAGAAPSVGNGAFLGEGVASGIPAWDAAAGGMGLGEAAAGVPLGTMGQAPISGIQPFNAADFEASLSQMTQPSAASLPMPDFAQAGMSGFSDIPGIQLSPQELQIPQLQMPSPSSLLPDLSAYQGIGIGTAGGLLGKAGAAASALGGAKALVPLAGGLLGAASSKDGAESSVQQKIDPRMAELLYGQGGLLGAGQDWFNANKGGSNTFKQGADMTRQFYNDPGYAEGFNRIKQQGLGLLGGGISANPFSTGAASLSGQRPDYFRRG